MAFLVLALEPGDDDDVAGVEELEHFLRGDVGNLRLGVELVGDDVEAAAPVSEMAFTPRPCSAVAVSAMVCCSPVETSMSSSRALWFRRNLTGQLDQAVGHARHGGDDDDEAMPGPVRLRDPAGHIEDALGRADRCAAIFLDKETTWKEARIAGNDLVTAPSHTRHRGAWELNHPIPRNQHGRAENARAIAQGKLEQRGLQGRVEDASP